MGVKMVRCTEEGQPGADCKLATHEAAQAPDNKKVAEMTAAAGTSLLGNFVSHEVRARAAPNGPLSFPMLQRKWWWWWWSFIG